MKELWKNLWKQYKTEWKALWDEYKSIIITTGPRFNKTVSMEEFKGIEDIRSSIFTGKLNYVYCDRCKG